MSKYEELKRRIEGLRNGWDKEADDIMQEIYRNTDYDNPKTHYEVVLRKQTISIQSLENIRNHKDYIWCKHFYDQCEKMEVFKRALLWLLDHSNVKKDEKKEAIKELERKVKELQEAIKELK